MSTAFQPNAFQSDAFQTIYLANDVDVFTEQSRLRIGEKNASVASGRIGDEFSRAGQRIGKSPISASGRIGGSRI